MKSLVAILLILISVSIHAQEDEFMATFIGDKEAFLSSKTGEFVFREHDKTDVSQLKTTEDGTVIYTDRKTHKVKKGETLSSIAKKHTTTIGELKTQNKLKNNSLSVAQELVIEKKYVVESSKPKVNQAEGRIIARLAPGQTPGGMTPPDLPPDAMPGNTINLITEDTKKEPIRIIENKKEPITGALNEDGSITHTVKSGETLFAIARKYKISLEDLKRDNNLALNTISVGQKLRVKVYNPEILNRKPQPKKASNVSKSEPAQVEKISETKEEIDKQLEEVEQLVDVTKKGATEKSTKKNAKVSDEAFNEIKSLEVSKDVEEATKIKEDIDKKVVEVTEPVVTQDIEKKPIKALKEVANTEDVTKKEVVKREKEEKIEALIDKYAKRETDAKIHLVQKGETLWGIAKKYNISVSKLKALNKLKNNNLSIDQQLKIK